jgi:hypothetical protein
LKFAQIRIKPQTTFNLHFVKLVSEKRSEIYNLIGGVAKGIRRVLKWRLDGGGCGIEEGWEGGVFLSRLRHGVVLEGCGGERVS